MPEEVSRVVKRKRIDGVDVPVIVQITFKDDFDRGWESQYTIDNSAQGDRDVHVATITADGTDETGQKDGLKVERVDVLRVLDGPDRGQESFFAPDSRTVNQPPDAPPYFITHEKTHIVRYINTPDDGNSLDSELIDEIRFNDPNDRGQDTYIILANPPDNKNIDGITVGDPVDGTNDGNGNPIYTIQVDPNLDDISDSENGIDPPWRLDPFQNIVSGGYLIVFMWQWFDWPIGSLADYQYFPPSAWNGVGVENITVQGSGVDAKVVTNPLGVSMVGDADHPLTTATLVNNNPTPPEKQLIGEPFPANHQIAACGYNASQTYVEFAAVCGHPPAPVMSQGTTTRNAYYLPFVFSGGPSTPPADDATSEQIDAYKPATFKDSFSDLKQELDEFYPQATFDTVGFDQPGDPSQPPVMIPNTVTLYTRLEGAQYPVIQAYVFSLKDVKLKLEDKFWPLRKKDDVTEYPDTISGMNEKITNTAKVAKCITVLTDYFYEIGRADITNPDQKLKVTLANDTDYEWRFEMLPFKYALDPKKRIPMLWPVTPAAKTVVNGAGNDQKVNHYTISVYDPGGPFAFGDLTSAAKFNIGDPPTGTTLPTT